MNYHEILYGIFVLNPCIIPQYTHCGFHDSMGLGFLEFNDKCRRIIFNF